MTCTRGDRPSVPRCSSEYINDGKCESIYKPRIFLVYAHFFALLLSSGGGHLGVLGICGGTPLYSYSAESQLIHGTQEYHEYI